MASPMDGIIAQGLAATKAAADANTAAAQQKAQSAYPNYGIGPTGLPYVNPYAASSGWATANATGTPQAGAPSAVTGGLTSTGTSTGGGTGQAGTLTPQQVMQNNPYTGILPAQQDTTGSQPTAQASQPTSAGAYAPRMAAQTSLAGGQATGQAPASGAVDASGAAAPADTSRAAHGDLSLSGLIGSIPVVGGIASGALTTLGNAVTTPNSYDVNKNLALSTQAAGNVYSAAMSPVANAPAWALQNQTVNTPNAINAQTVAAPNAIMAGTVNTPNAINAQTVTAPNAINAQTVNAPGAINAQTVNASPLLAGAPADALRQQALDQAASAASSPSAAQAQMRAAGNQIENQQAGLAAQARGADRAGARRAAMLATGTQEQGAAATSAALAAQEETTKQAQYATALQGVRSGDVNAGQALTQVGGLNQAANLQGQAQTAQNQLAAATANQAANLTGQIQTGNQALTAQTANQAANLQAQTTTGAQALTAEQANQQAGLTAQINTGQQALTAGTANQAANLQAQTTTGAQALNAGEANQAANLQAQQGTLTGAQNAYTQTLAAQNARMGTALQAVGATNQAQGVAASYGTNQNALQSQTASNLVGAGTSAVGMMSDERAKDEISAIGDTSDADLDALMSSTHGTTSPEQMEKEFPTAPTTSSWQDAAARIGKTYNSYGGSQVPLVSIPQPTAGQDFLSWRMPAPSVPQQKDSSKSGLTSLGTLIGLSDERAKHEVEQMDAKEVADWAEAVPTATWRYKPGVPGTDGGEDYHTGTIAQGLEGTGPLGQLMVHRDHQTGLKQVEYGPLGLMVGKGALHKANEALNWAKAAYSMASGKGGHRVD